MAPNLAKRPAEKRWRNWLPKRRVSTRKGFRAREYLDRFADRWAGLGKDKVFRPMLEGNPTKEMFRGALGLFFRQQLKGVREEHKFRAVMVMEEVIQNLADHEVIRWSKLIADAPEETRHVFEATFRNRQLLASTALELAEELKRELAHTVPPGSPTALSG